jgi:sulfite oxidase
VAFTGLDKIGKEERSTSNFGGSVPVEKGASSEILLAYEMNDEPLSTEHGFPLRVVWCPVI